MRLGGKADIERRLRVLKVRGDGETLTCTMSIWLPGLLQPPIEDVTHPLPCPAPSSWGTRSPSPGDPSLAPAGCTARSAHSFSWKRLWNARLTRLRLDKPKKKKPSKDGLLSVGFPPLINNNSHAECGATRREIPLSGLSCTANK